MARCVAAMLESVGWTVWRDRPIPAGETWLSMLEKALENMRRMIVLWSARSIANGVGSRQTMVGNGRDDTSNALDRRVEFKVIGC